MELPDTAALTAAGAFITGIWTANPMLVILFGVNALLTVGFFALRKATHSLPR